MQLAYEKIRSRKDLNRYPQKRWAFGRINQGRIGPSLLGTPKQISRPASDGLDGRMTARAKLYFAWRFNLSKMMGEC